MRCQKCRVLLDSGKCRKCGIKIQLTKTKYKTFGWFGRPLLLKK